MVKRTVSLKAPYIIIKQKIHINYKSPVLSREEISSRQTQLNDIVLQTRSLRVQMDCMSVNT